MNYDDLADVLQYHKEIDIMRASNNNGTKYRIDIHEIVLGQLGGYEEGPIVDMLCNMAKEISLYRYDDTEATIFVAKTRSCCYVLTEKAYKKIKRKVREENNESSYDLNSPEVGGKNCERGKKGGGEKIRAEVRNAVQGVYVLHKSGKRRWIL